MGFQAVGRDPDNLTLDTNASGLLQIKALGISNSHISATAAIAKAKLAALNIVNADVDVAAAIAKSKLAALDILNVDVNAAAAILKSKLAALGIIDADIDAAANISASKTQFGAAGAGSLFLRRNAANTSYEWAAAGDAVKMDSGNATTTSGIEVQLGTKTFAASDFAANDLLLVIIQSGNTGAATSNRRIRIADGTNTFTSTLNGSPTGPFVGFSQFVVSQRADVNTELDCSALNQAQATVEHVNDRATMIANWITSAFTLSYRGEGTTTGFHRWWAYKLKA